MKALNPAHSVAIFDARPAELRIGVRTLGWFTRELSGFSLKDVDRSRGLAHGVAKQLWLIYLKAMISAMRPKAVVTFIDNSGEFHWLSRNCRELPFIAIQNGTRLRCAAAADRISYYLQHLFSFGAHESRVFPELGFTVENYYPVGSLVASLHFGPATEIEYDILIVSTWRGNIGYKQDVQDTMRGMKIMDESLAGYIRWRGLRAAVILRSERDSDQWLMPEVGKTEEQYFSDIYGDSIDIIDTDFAARNIFPLMQKSHLVVSCLSTALLEAYGIGKKVLYFNFTGTDAYHADLDSSIVVSDASRDAAYDRLDSVLNMPQGEYQRLHGERQRYYMSFPNREPTPVVIANTIDDIIRSRY